MRRRLGLAATATTGVALIALLGGLASCAGIGSANADQPARITLLDHQGSRRFELVNEAHTSSVEYYSVPRTEASRKVVDNDLLAALLDELEDLGLDSYARAGRAPSRAPGSGSSAGATLTRSIELDRASAVK